MQRQMCWLSGLGDDGDKILHLQTAPGQPWRPYTACREYAVPDYKIPGGSKGWATYQKLLKAGWTLIPSSRANEFVNNFSDSIIQNQ
ncbi:hypothetical protein H6G33_22715 [Calothrix sp. FACHB-1219]|uniref:hypothetical protein n=1 Tax=unclassified Calothrix TaxID=2619626 RepID=UPI000B61E64C|nr:MULTISPECIES: hypothetical protein [unclassified Calothrix]MBD2205027.1 hypothetical protein [Calothrix sp. FACHB-168]MBD2219825.1 hypothetical protein [Calothrix sp. FACHB-1219]BAY65933.1 hypothetical protein NIES22_60450 [Calothrix brevissima NIES-22]